MQSIELAEKQKSDRYIPVEKPPRFIKCEASNTPLPDNNFDVGIMQALLTTLTTKAKRLACLMEARRIIKLSGGLYLAEFLQSWDVDTYGERYELGIKETGQRGSFIVRNTSTGKAEFEAHHYDENELSGLLDAAGFTIKSFEHQKFTTRSGDEINGVIIWAC